MYITASEIAGDVSIGKVLLRAEWNNSDIEKRISEAVNYIEGRFFLIGYTRSQLLEAPIITDLVLNYTKYCILRDIYTQTSPGKGNEENYLKWKENVENILLGFCDRKLALIDKNGNILSPELASFKNEVYSNTLNVPQIITMEDSSRWNIPPEYSDKNTIGKR